MEQHTGDALITDLRALATYVAKGGHVEWEEPEPRGRKGPDRSRHRFVQIRITEPGRFDAIRWRLISDPRFKRPPRGP